VSTPTAEEQMQHSLKVSTNSRFTLCTTVDRTTLGKIVLGSGVHDSTNTCLPVREHSCYPPPQPTAEYVTWHTNYCLLWHGIEGCMSRPM